MSTFPTTIPKARPEHISLDFDLLRAEGIQHLEKLATEIWTDFNAHDPGISLLELLCYAITDLSYRTRMLPIEDLLASPNSTQAQWFAATEVLPNAPVTERDFRKLLTDVKGVKNAWLRKARPEEIVMMMYRRGWIFPEFMDENGQWDENKLKALAKSLHIPYLSHNANGQANPSLASCIEAYFKQFELDPKLSTYQSAIKAIGGKDMLKKVELERYFRNQPAAESVIAMEKQLELAEQYLDSEVTGAIFPAYDLAYQQVVTEYSKTYTSYEAFKTAGLDKDITDLGFTKVTDKLQALNDFLTTNGIEFTPTHIEDFMLSINHDLAIGDQDDALIELLEADKPNSTSGKITKIREYVSAQEKVISQVEYGVILNYLNGNGNDNPNATALASLWEDLNDLYNDAPTWDKIEEAAFNNLEGASLPNVDFDKFKEIVTVEIPTAEAFELAFGDNLVAQYINPTTQELTLSYQAYSSFLQAAFNLNNAQTTVEELLNFSENAPRTDCSPLGDYLIEHLCKYGYYGLTTQKDQAHRKFKDFPLALNGIYQIILDLDDNINAADAKAVETVVNRAMKRLHANRALCEDFLTPQIVEQRPVHFCIHLDVAADVDERKVMAQVIWNIQQYLSPTLRFRNFKEMHDLGIHCDEIYNGPLLCSGFLNDAEVDQAQLLEEYYHSDLVRIALQTPGVLGVRELKVKATPEGKVAGSKGLKLIEDAIYPVYPAVEVDEISAPPPFIKRVIELCNSCFFVSKGSLMPVQLTECALQEHLDWIKMTEQCEFCTEPGGHVPVLGTHRPDLADYRSIQYDLPSVYAVGDHRVLEDAPDLHKAQARQLQAYSAFFDQIMASYLAQLGQVNQLLSVQQDVHAATRLLPALYEVPGLRELIDHQAVFSATPEDWALAMADLPLAEQQALISALGNLATQTTEFTGFQVLREMLAQHLNSAQNAVYNTFFCDFFWGKYIADESNNYRKALAKEAETHAHQQAQRNRLTDHLLARFGETFGTYVHTLLAPDAEPEENPWRQDFEAYLEDKAGFLREVAALSHDRGRGYNYRKMSANTHQPDVWLSPNVAGVKKRVSRLVGIDDYHQKSLIAEPPYRLDIVPSQTSQGTAQYRIVLKKRPEATVLGENPVQTLPLLYSIRYSSKKKVQEKVTELYKNIWKTSLFKTFVSESDPDQYVVKFTLADHELQSDGLSEAEALALQLMVQDLVQPGKGEVEGCHVLEHILLRPNDPKDHLLQIPLGCDPKETPYDPYSFWITVVLPNWTSRFKHADFQYFFEQTFRAETPAHIAIRFCWVDLQTMYVFEDAYRKWMIEKAKCSPSECHVTDAANTLIDLLNSMPCSCHCPQEIPEDLCDSCGKPDKKRPKHG